MEKWCAIMYTHSKSKKVKLFLNDYWTKNNKKTLKRSLKFIWYILRFSCFSGNTHKRLIRQIFIFVLYSPLVKPIRPMLKASYRKIKGISKDYEITDIGSAVDIVMETVIPVSEVLHT